MSAKFRSGILTGLGGTGYVIVTFEWLAVMAAWLPNFPDSKLGKLIFPKQITQPTPVPVQSAGGVAVGPDFVTTFLVTCIAILVVGIVLYVVIVRYTSAINRTGSRVAHTAVKKAGPIIARKPMEELTSKKRTILSRRILFWSKIILIIIPLALLPIVLKDGERGLVEQFAVFMQVVLALIAACSFFAQAVLINHWHVHTDSVN